MPELSFRYVSPDRAAPERDLLLLEQEAWSAYTGVLTRAGLAFYARAAIYGGTADARMTCGFSGDTLHTVIYAWPLAPGVVFRLRASVGDLGAVQVDTVSTGESVTYNLTDHASLRHPADRIEEARWLTGPYNSAGEAIAPPALTVSGRDLILSEPVWGSVWIRTAGTRYTCRLSISRDAAEPLLAAGWSEYVIGLPEGGRPVALELTPPPGAEELARSGAECGRISYRVVPPGGNGPPVAQPRDKHIKCDYCELECDGDD